MKINFIMDLMILVQNRKYCPFLQTWSNLGYLDLGQTQRSLCFETEGVQNKMASKNTVLSNLLDKKIL